MKYFQNNHNNLNKLSDRKKVKSLNSLTLLGLFAVTFLLSSCEAIAGIFKAGMGFGIFLVIAVVLIIVFIAMKAGKKN
jgi:hypothetical protein